MSDEQKPQETKTDMIAAAKGLPPTEVFSLKPRTFEEAFRFANLIAESTLIPKEFQKSPANVLIAVQLGMELGVAPMQALQNIAVINGRPVIWGDLVPAIVYQSGLCEQFDEVADNSRATCTVKRKGFPAITRTFTMEQAKLAGLADRQTYKQYPARMLQMRARGFAVRDAFPDVLKGVHLREEIEDDEPRDVTPIRTPQALTEKPSEQPKPNSNPEPVREKSATSAESGKRNSRNREAKTPVEEHKAEPQAPEPPAQQAEKSQEEWIAECILWVDNAPPEQLLSDDNWLFTVGIKQLHGMKNQMEALKPFNARRHALAKAQ